VRENTSTNLERKENNNLRREETAKESTTVKGEKRASTSSPHRLERTCMGDASPEVCRVVFKSVGGAQKIKLRTPLGEGFTQQRRGGKGS